jgi:ParB-like nuclease domain
MVRRNSGDGKRRPKRTTPNEDVGLVQQMPISDIRPSPENDRIYRPIRGDDPAIVRLSESIREYGVLEPLIVTADGYIVSGHRRFAGAKVAGLESVPCRVLDFRREDDPDKFLRLLREHNRQREKTNDERLREEVIDLDPDDCYAELRNYRRGQATVESKPMRIIGETRRRQIAGGERLFLAAVTTVLEFLRDYWPVSDRRVHYGLVSLAVPPFLYVHPAGSKRAARAKQYANDLRSYKALTDLLTRARLQGLIPWEAIGDETRPVEVWNFPTNVRPFISDQLAGMFRGYSRDLMQSQPNHIEIIGEKLTIEPIIRPVASDYCIPFSIGRGYCSINPRRQMAERFEDSGRVRLILLILSDLDPDGVVIGQSFARSMRDDFGIDEDDLHPVRVALTPEQVRTHKLPRSIKAKTSSNHFEAFRREYGTFAYELDALPPAVLQQCLRDAIESVIDRAAFDGEVAAEREDARYLAGVRRQATNALAGIVEDDDE